MSASRRRREFWSERAGAPRRVLIVDDDAQVQGALEWLLRSRGYQTVCVGDADAARARVADEPFHLVLCDIRLPGRSGLEFAQDLAAEQPHTPVVMISGIDDREVEETALEVGAYDYVTKPFTANDLFLSVANALRRRESRLESEATARHLSAMLAEHRVALSGARLELAQERVLLQQSRRETLYRLARVAEVRNPAIGSHMERVGLYAERLARRMGLEEARCVALRLASPLHDIGKIGLPDEILLKPGPLDADERAMMRRHTQIGCSLLADEGDELLNLASVIALTHHEAVDGSGYPHGLSGDQIMLESRIVSVADAFDAMTSDRPYRGALTFGCAADTIKTEAGKQFDPHVVEALLSVLDAFAVTANAGNASVIPLGRDAA